MALHPRYVAARNVSRISRCIGHFNGDDVSFERAGFALEPCADYELRSEPGGYGGEDPRVTYVSPLELCVITYCAYGPTGARVAAAISRDGLAWERLGLVNFLIPHPAYNNKTASAPMRTPSSIESAWRFSTPSTRTSCATARRNRSSHRRRRGIDRRRDLGDHVFDSTTAWATISSDAVEIQ